MREACCSFVRYDRRVSIIVLETVQNEKWVWTREYYRCIQYMMVKMGRTCNTYIVISRVGFEDLVLSFRRLDMTGRIIQRVVHRLKNSNWTELTQELPFLVKGWEGLRQDVRWKRSGGQGLSGAVSVLSHRKRRDFVGIVVNQIAAERTPLVTLLFSLRNS